MPRVNFHVLSGHEVKYDSRGRMPLVVNCQVPAHPLRRRSSIVRLSQTYVLRFCLLLVPSQCREILSSSDKLTKVGLQICAMEHLSNPHTKVGT